MTITTSDISFTAPHYGVTEIAQGFLRAGVNAVDAMISASAAVSVLYPHMNSLAGDGFWLIQRPGEKPVAIDACGTAAKNADIPWYKKKGFDAIPPRAGPAALCMGGTLDGWRVARQYMESVGCVSKPLSELLAPAIDLAANGIEVTHSLQLASEKVHSELSSLTAFKDLFCPQNRTLQKGDRLKNIGLSRFLQQLADSGTEDFYKGDIAGTLAEWLESEGSPLTVGDFQNYSAQVVQPLETTIGESNSAATCFNLPAPTQGIASLLILAIYDKLIAREKAQTESEHIHYLVEATKQAFLIRDREVTDPSRLSSNWNSLLSEQSIAACVANISKHKALPWPKTAEPGDTVWMGAVDSKGCMVSFIQSIYWEFGSGLVNPDYGLVWNNRGTSFSLDDAHPNALKPGLKPFHTLNPAFIEFNDGRRLIYGSMGGEGQPQTQAAIISRYEYQGFSLSESVSRGRWLLGRTWGAQDQDLKLEEDLYELVGAELEALGHQISQVSSKNELMGHAGAICLHPNGIVDASTDPRSDGRACIDAFS